MILLLQRVLSASVTIEQIKTAKIQHGILALVGFERNDTCDIVNQKFNKLLHYRIFSDSAGKMNLNVQQVKGSVLFVPQFTLVADTSKGLRPSFSRSANPEQGNTLFTHLTQIATTADTPCQFGVFGADMQIALVNDGPVTFTL